MIFNKFVVSSIFSSLSSGIRPCMISLINMAARNITEILFELDLKVYSLVMGLYVCMKTLGVNNKFYTLPLDTNTNLAST